MKYKTLDNLFFSFLEEEGVSDVDAAFDVTFPARKAFLVNRFNIENSTYKRAVMVLTRSCLPVSPNSFSTKRARRRCWSELLLNQAGQVALLFRSPLETLSLSQPSGPRWHCWSGLPHADVLDLLVA